MFHQFLNELQSTAVSQAPRCAWIYWIYWALQGRQLNYACESYTGIQMPYYIILSILSNNIFENVRDCATLERESLSIYTSSVQFVHWSICCQVVASVEKESLAAGTPRKIDGQPGALQYFQLHLTSESSDSFLAFANRKTFPFCCEAVLRIEVTFMSSEMRWAGWLRHSCWQKDCTWIAPQKWSFDF